MEESKLKTANSNFYLKSLTLLVSILKMVDKGATQTEIAQMLHMRKPQVSYYIRRAIEIGYIKKIIRDKIKICELTQQGKIFVDQYDNNAQTRQLPSCRAENIRFKAVIFKLPARAPDWHKVEMNNWSQYNSIVDDTRVKLNMGNTPTIEFLPSPVDGDNTWELYGILYNDCNEVARKLEQILDMKIGRLEIEPGAEWVVYNPVADTVCKYNGQITIEGVGKVNASKPSRRGAIEYFNPLQVAEYFAMPKNISEINKSLYNIQKMLEEEKGR